MAPGPGRDAREGARGLNVVARANHLPQMTGAPLAGRSLAIFIPGDPVSQGRGRAIPTARGIRVKDPERSIAWKRAAAARMFAARFRAGLRASATGPLEVTVAAFFRCPKAGVRQENAWRPSRPDADNLGKAALDAGNGVLWDDDSQVVRLVVEKRYAADEAPAGVVVVVRAAPEPTAGIGALRLLMVSQR